MVVPVFLFPERIQAVFVDEVVIQVEAGRGGDGCRSFRREKFVPRGGPDGGDGGDGGSVVVLAEAGVDSLAALAHRKHWRAKNGERGGSSQCHGAAAEDLILRVPPGTLIRDGREGFVIKDLARPGDRVVVAHGGKGGKGNAHFKSPTNRAPRTVTPGGEGEQRLLRLELKVIADVGLVGKPNAGKSTLLSRLSRARPEIAAYPFTTKHPNLGRVQIDYDWSFIMADIPGLIEGAHTGVGLGHEFLKHIQRSGVLVHLVEPAPEDGTDPVTNYRTIREELEKFDVELVRRPEVVAVTKADVPAGRSVQQRLADEIGREVLLISAVTGQGLHDLIGRVAHELQQSAASPR